VDEGVDPAAPGPDRATPEANRATPEANRAAPEANRAAPGSDQVGRPGPVEPGPDRATPTALGEAGEQLAARWYESRGYEVLERNWRRREGEVDLIVREGRTVVFVEVKARSSARYGAGVEAVLPAKQRRIRRLAERWLAELTPAAARSRVTIRFDVVSITAGRISVVEAAF